MLKLLEDINWITSQWLHDRNFSELGEMSHKVLAVSDQQLLTINMLARATQSLGFQSWMGEITDRVVSFSATFC